MVQFVDLSLNDVNHNHLSAHFPQLRLHIIDTDSDLYRSKGEKVKSNMCETTQKQYSK